MVPPPSTVSSFWSGPSAASDHGSLAKHFWIDGHESVLAASRVAAGRLLRPRSHCNPCAGSRPPHRNDLVFRCRHASLARRRHLVGRWPDSWRRINPGAGDRPRCVARAHRLVQVGAAASMAPAGRLPRERHRTLRDGGQRAQVRHQHGLPARYRRPRRHLSVRAPVRGPAGRIAARRLFPRFPCLDRVLADGVLFPAAGHPAPPGTGPPRGRRSPWDGLFLRPAGPGRAFPLPRPHQRRAGLVPAPVPVVAAAKISCSRGVAVGPRA